MGRDTRLRFLDERKYTGSIGRSHLIARKFLLTGDRVVDGSVIETVRGGWHPGISFWPWPTMFMSNRTTGQATGGHERCHSATLRNRSALPTTDNELRLIATLAQTGEISRPKTG